MTNQASEDELRAEILTEFRQVHKLAPADYTENCTNFVMHLITADRKRVALEARIDELEKFVNTTNRSLSVKKLRDRLSALKSQQEEV